MIVAAGCIQLPVMLFENMRFSSPSLCDSTHVFFAYGLCDLLFRNRGIQLALHDDHTRNGLLAADSSQVLQRPLPIT